MGKQRSKFDSEFKIKIAQEVLSGQMSLMEASRHYQLAKSTINGWVEKLRNGLEVRPIVSKREKELEKENLKLKEKLAELYLQVDVLKKVENWKLQQKNASLSIITSKNLAQFKKGVKC